jgi:hypothetical protein
MAKRDVLEIRRDRLRELMRVRGGPGALAKKLGYSSGSYLSQVAGPTPTREISERVARAMEKLLQLPDGYLDREEDPPSAPAVDVQAPLVADIVHIVMDIIDSAPQRPSSSKIAEVVALAYEQASATGGKVDREFVRRLLRLVS